MLATIISFIAQTIASSAVVILGFIAIRSTNIGERFISHHFDRKIADLKHAHEEKIEALRSDLAHLQDRGRRANELEFDAVTKVWHSFVDAWLKTQQAIMEYMSFPDLNNLSEGDLATFIDSTELSNPQRQQVLSSSDKNDMYSKILRLRTINIAGAAIYDGRQVLRRDGIFIPASVAKSFREPSANYLMLRLSDTQHGHGAGGGYQKSMEVLDTGGENKMFATLESLVRTTIRRDQR
jgi:hypothetical protein